MRTLFLEALIDTAKTAGLGIESGCLADVVSLIDQVVSDHQAALRDPREFAKAYGAFQEFVNRMVREAQRTDSASLHEDTVAAARQQCGLIFWCAP